MKKYINIKNIIILILTILVILSIINPGGLIPNRVTKVPVHLIDLIPYPQHDTIPFEVEVEVEVPVEVKVPYAVHDTVLTPVDTMAILKDFYAKNLSKEELKLPNNQGIITLNQTVTENKIVSTEFDAKISPKVQKDTILLPEPKKNQLYFGIVGGLSKQDYISNIGAGLLFKTKEDKIFKFTVGAANRLYDENNGRFNPYMEGGVFWKIKTKKRN